MPDTIREQIIKKIEARLKMITVENGYNTDAGRVVYYGRSQEPNPQDLPAINFWDSTEQAADGYGYDARKFNLTIEMFDKEPDMNVPAVGNKFKADLDKAIYRNDGTQNPDEFGCFFDELAHHCKFINSQLFLLESDVGLGGLIAEYEITYQQKYADPYTLDE